VVDRSGQFAEELRKPLEVGGIECGSAPGAELACSALELFRIAGDKNDLGALEPRSPGCLEADAGAAANHDDRLSGKFRFGLEGRKGCGAHEFHLSSFGIEAMPMAGHLWFATRDFICNAASIATSDCKL
jgi:hypothetical protein